MDFRLGDGARAVGHRLHVHDRLGSTNTEALDQARAGATGPLWVAAHAQEAGRGRRGNAWASVPGNLTASVLWPVAGVEPERVAGLGFVAGVALVETLEAVCGPGSAGTFGLKWPNDVLAGGAKLAGILLEAETLPGGRRAVAIGFGVNVAGVPEAFSSSAASLAGLGYPGDAGMVLADLTNKLAAAARIWDRGRGFPEIRERWLARASGLGSRIAVRSGTETLVGDFEDIDEGGRLVILAPDGTRRTVTAGEVHFGTAATAA
ncbi:Bifunctional ligase/repressor BirA [Methylobacterium cerastii]|uniref:biotin--[biotin carboxyl-carrier protein] ligase n=1 Tax=Methylobacterium cerastii TaxID=932741 RepID=A0ABQ4QCZ3_9HYPH|nr:MULTISPECIES: biotin--[acetyl-CoA-carboxylase] ligase [Methylobacterium]TXN84503.1 biotin--[acetyl-CoA-carboxylase] ligase [Methylobacterium sp. WL8]GJD43062.1 Bifunctional ligase/repressor BirA [Methylobacterium cerastii]